MSVSLAAVVDPTAHEEEPSGVPVGISIQHLTKIYDEVIIYNVINVRVRVCL